MDDDEDDSGIQGFYSASLVKYGEAAPKLLSKSIELGRSFIVKKYQREVQPLRLLLTGLAVAATKCPGSAYFSGTVSISNDIPLFYKSLITRYLEKSYPMEDAARIATPTHPFEPDFMAVDPDGLLQIVTEINHTQVTEEEILADSVYHFTSGEQNIVKKA